MPPRSMRSFSAVAAVGKTTPAFGTFETGTPIAYGSASHAFEAADHVPEILRFNPIGLEGFEGSMVDGLRKKGAPHLELVPEGRGYLLVEFGLDDAAEASQTATRFLEWVR